MARQVKHSKATIPTIDCELITIETNSGEFGFDTANAIAPEPQIEETDAVKLVVKGVLRAQKRKETTITGHEIKLTDNVFNPELVLILQGGTIIYDPANPDEIVGYEPPVAGSIDKGETFKLNAYSAQYDASGQIVKYEKITYPNCQGGPVAFSSEDGTFRAPEYTITSAPNGGEAPYKISYVTALPVLVNEYALGDLEVVSEEGATTGTTAISVSPVLEVYTNKYFYKTSATEITLPTYGEVLVGYTEWDGLVDITVATGQYIAIVETSSDSKALSGGTVVVVAKA